MKDRIKEIITEEVGVDFNLVSGEHLDSDLYFDTFDYVSVEFAIEKEFNISINTESKDWQTIDDIIKTIEELIVDHVKQETKK